MDLEGEEGEPARLRLAASRRKALGDLVIVGGGRTCRARGPHQATDRVPPRAQKTPRDTQCTSPCDTRWPPDCTPSIRQNP